MTRTLVRLALAGAAVAAGTLVTTSPAAADTCYGPDVCVPAICYYQQTPPARTCLALQ